MFIKVTSTQLRDDWKTLYPTYLVFINISLPSNSKYGHIHYLITGYHDTFRCLNLLRIFALHFSQQKIFSLGNRRHFLRNELFGFDSRNDYKNILSFSSLFYVGGGSTWGGLVLMVAPWQYDKNTMWVGVLK